MQICVNICLYTFYQFYINIYRACINTITWQYYICLYVCMCRCVWIAQKYKYTYANILSKYKFSHIGKSKKMYLIMCALTTP